LIREWGRIAPAGQRKIELHESEGAALGVLDMCVRRKQRLGYVTRPD
jgi:predicted DNA-binding WGR domain protein